jgi:hypothetical protein
VARKKNYFSFLDFNYAEGAFDLFQNTIRGAFEYDSLTDDVFQAKVLTEPTPIADVVGDLRGVADRVNKDLNQKYSFRVRILGINSPHRFLEDPCPIKETRDDFTADKIFSIINNHTEVILYDNSNERRPKMGDIVNIKLSRSGNSFDIRRASQYIGIASEIDINIPLNTKKPECIPLASIFDPKKLTSLGNPSVNEAAAQAVIQSFKANSLPAINAARSGIQEIIISSGIRTTEQGRKMIWRMANQEGIKTTITEQDAAKNPTEVERLRSELEKKGYKVAPPEDSNHNPAKGKVAIDLQSTGNDKPSYSQIQQLVKDYFEKTNTEALGFTLHHIEPEPDNGTIFCPADPTDPKSPKDPENPTKCGVVHIDLLPNDALAPQSTATSNSPDDTPDPTTPTGG